MGSMWALALTLLLYSVTGSWHSSALVCMPLVVAGYVDSVRHLLPDPLLLLAAACAVLTGLIDSTFGWSSIMAAACGALIGYFLSFVTSLGRGDAKLIGVLGLWLGPQLAVAGLLAIIAAGVYALALVLGGRASLTTPIALGPWIVAASLCTFITSEILVRTVVQ